MSTDYFLRTTLLTIMVAPMTITLSPLTFSDDTQMSKIELFSRLPEKEQKNDLLEVFSHRLTLAKNLKYHLELEVDFHNFRDGKVGEKTGPTFKKNYTHYQFNDSYRMDMELFLPNKAVPTQQVSTFYDSINGVNMGLFKADEMKDRFFGRIDSKQDHAISENHYRAWLQDSWFAEDMLNKNAFIFPYLIEHVKLWEITSPVENNYVQITVPYKSPWVSVSNSDGNRVILLDPEKNFMPIKGVSRWDGLSGDNEKRWWEEKFSVDESLLINDVWMPTSLWESINASSAPEVLTISKMRIKEIEHGKLKGQDLKFVFPEGTEVTDAINGISYKTDANGNPIQSTVEALYGLDPSQVKMPGSEPSRRINYIFMILGIGMIIVALYLQFKKRFAST